jgi:hypothetical protein
MRDGVVSVAEPSAHPSVSLLRALKREFGFYCIELSAEPVVEQPEAVFMMGGTNRIGGKLSSMERYDASSDQWSVAAAMDIGRHAFGVFAIADELYVCGGFDDGDELLSSVKRYSPSSNIWSTIVPLPEARAMHAAVSVGWDMYVLGGSIDRGGTASVLKFDNTYGTWHEVAPMPEARRDFSACAVGSDIYVFSLPSYQSNHSVFRYDTEANSWTILAPMPQNPSASSASVLNDLVYIVGVGHNKREVLRFDPASGEWSNVAPTRYGRLGGSSFVLDGCLYAVGGMNDSVGDISRARQVERYELNSDTWAYVTHMLEGRRFFGSVTIGSSGPTEEQDLFNALITKVIRQRP